jgi:hypothetical protein
MKRGELLARNIKNFKGFKELIEIKFLTTIYFKSLSIVMIFESKTCGATYNILCGANVTI